MTSDRADEMLFEVAAGVGNRARRCRLNPGHWRRPRLGGGISRPLV